MSKLISQIIEGKISITQVFLFLYSNIDKSNEAVYNWITKELYGYNRSDVLPDYRKNNMLPYLKYNGISGNFQVNNTPLPLHYLSEKTVEELKSNYNVVQSISAIEKNSLSDDNFHTDVTSFLQIEVLDKTDGGIQCSSIRQMIPIEIFESSLIKIKMKLIDIIKIIESEYGTLDGLYIENEGSKISNDLVLRMEKLVFEDNSISIGDNNELNKVKVRNR